MPRDPNTDPNASGLVAAARENGLAIAGAWKIRAEAGPDGAAKVPTAQIVLYAGGPIRQYWSDVPMVIDLKGFDTSRQKIPVNFNHNTRDPECTLGQSTSVKNDGKQITLSADLFNTDSEICQQVISLAKAGFEWQASVGGDVDETEYVGPKERVAVNGRSFEGPILVVRAGRLREATICQQGADPNTSAAIAAQARGVSRMPLPKNPDPGAPAPNTPAGSPLAASAPAPAVAPAPAPAPIVAAAGGDGASVGDDVAKKILAAQLAEAEAKAAAAKLQLENLMGLQAHRQSLPAAPAAHIAGRAISQAGLKAMGMAAALCMAAGMRDASLTKQFKTDQLEAGNDLRQGMSLQTFFLQAAREAGYSSPEHRIHPGNAEQVLRAAFSQHDISVALGSAYGKFVLDSFQTVADSDPWAQFTSNRPVSDFKTVTGVRTMGDFSFKRATNSGSLEDANLVEQSRTLKADLWGRCTVFSMEDMVNDDTGRLNELGTNLGEGGALGFLEDYYATFLAAIAAGYYITPTAAAGNALSLTSLRASKALIERQRNAAGKPIVMKGRLILTPPELEVTALDLMKPGNVLITGENKTLTNGNSLAGRYGVASTQFLPSQTGWGLVGGLGGIQPMQVAWLNGVQTPTIQNVEPRYDNLGFVIRGWMAWGCKAAEKPAMVWNEIA